MPATHTIPVPTPPTLYTVTRNGIDQHVYVLDKHGDEVYVHYLNMDKRMDEWILEANLRTAQVQASTSNGTLETTTFAGTKRKRDYLHEPPLAREALGHLQEEETITISEEDYDLEQHKRITAQRNFDKVHFGEWQIKTWYFSPYPLAELELELENAASASSTPTSNSPASGSPSQPRAQKSSLNIPGPRIPGIPRTTPRSHVRTSDLLAGGLGRQNVPPGERATLWVCDMCFKYMAEGQTWEMHKRECTLKHPPGNKVYQRGAHTIWEVDGAKEKLYCQNLSLFGKLFIDVKTLYFDCDNFLFYILTDATSQADHMMGFFSKEKASFDNYNLACIITLPPYQRQGYGMLMIEFSYELSRRANQVGTPERPLSDLGLRSYLAYWVATLIRFFRHVLSALPYDTPRQTITTRGTFPDVLNEYRSPSSSSSGQEDVETSSANTSPKKRRKSIKGWDGENGAGNETGQSNQTIVIDDPQFTSMRTFTTTLQDDGSAVTHVSVRCTLSDIANATNLRIEDAAFALNECGLLAKRIRARRNPAGNADAAEGTGIAGVSASDTVVLTRQMVEQVAKERNVKKPCMDRARIVVLISGSGSNLQALIDAKIPNSEIVLVLSNRKNAYGLTRAAKASIPTAYLGLQPYLKNNPGKTRDDYDAEVAQIVLREKPDVVVLAGWMHILGERFLGPLDRASVPAINLHPALPGAFDGANAIERAYEAFQSGEIDGSGAMVHRVVKDVDRGEPIIVRTVAIVKGEPKERFEARLHAVEHEIIVEATAIVLNEVKPL